MLKIGRSKAKVKIKAKRIDPRIEPNKSQRPSLRLKQMRNTKRVVYRKS